MQSKPTLQPEEAIKKCLMSQNRKRFIEAYLLKGGKICEFSLLEYLLFHNPEQSAILNQVSATYCHYNGQNCIWYGKDRPRAEQGMPQFQYYAQTLSNLEEFLKRNYSKSFKYQVYCLNEDFESLELRLALKDIAVVKLYDSIKIENKDNKDLFFPNFTPITGENKTYINIKRYNIFWILSGQNFAQAKEDFLKIFKKVVQKQPFNQKYKKFLDDYIEKTASLIPNFKDQIWFYTGDNIYHKMINIALKSLNFPEDIGYFRFPILRLFCAIAKLFQEQAGLPKRVQGFTCYRGCFLAEEQYNTLKNNIGQAIQMDGFLSTSESRQYVRSGFGDYMIVINVPPISKTTNLFSCFAFIEKFSQYAYEEQVLFTPLNTFVVKDVYEKGGLKTIQLNFVCFDNLSKLELYGEAKENFQENFRFQMSMFFENNDQSQTLFRIRRQKDPRVIDGFKVKIQKGLQRSRLKINTKQEKPYILGQKITKRLLNSFQKKKKINFNWPSSQNQCLKLVNQYVYDNIKRRKEIFYFFGQAIDIYQLDEEESNFYLYISLIIQIKLTGLNQMEAYNTASYIARNYEHLDYYEESEIFYKHNLNFLQKNSQRFSINYIIFLIAPLLFHLHIGNKDQVALYKILVLEHAKRSIESQKNAQKWTNLLQKYEDFQFMKQFKVFFDKTYGDSVYFIIKLFFQALQNFQQKDEDEIKITIGDCNQKYKKLELCLPQFEKTVWKNFLPCENIIMVTIFLRHDYKRQLCHSKILQFEKTLKQISFSPYINFHAAIIGIKYLAKSYKILGIHFKQDQKWQNLLQSVHKCLKYVLEEYKYHNYAHFLILLTLCEICILLEWDRSFFKMFKILLYFKKRLRLILKQEFNRYLKLVKFGKKKLFSVIGSKQKILKTDQQNHQKE